MKKLNLVVIGGASTYTPELIDQIINNQNELNLAKITLLDIALNKEKLSIIEGLSKRMLSKAKLDIEIIATTNRRDALKNADFIILQLRVGKQNLRFFDETIPYQYGLLGHETIGIGGLFSALRTVPVIYEIIEDIKEICPNAWTLCVTNPIGIISEAVFRFSEYERFIGICTDPLTMHEELAEAMNVKRNEIIPYIGGVNELSFATKVYKNHKDKLPELLKNSNLHECVNLSKNELTVLECYPNPAVEFNIHHEEILETRAKKPARAKVVAQIENELFEIYKDEHLDTKPKELEKRIGTNYAKEVIDIMISMVQNKKNYFVVNTINRGHITDIREECAIEITSRLTSKGPLPVHIGELPQSVKGLVQHQKAYEELLCDAIYEKNLTKALMALKLHPLTRSSKQATNAFNELLKVNKPYLTYYGDFNDEIN